MSRLPAKYQCYSVAVLLGKGIGNSGFRKSYRGINLFSEILGGSPLGASMRFGLGKQGYNLSV
jgi:hypothetical protein